MFPDIEQRKAIRDEAKRQWTHTLLLEGDLLMTVAKVTRYDKDKQELEISLVVEVVQEDAIALTLVARSETYWTEYKQQLYLEAEKLLSYQSINLLRVIMYSLRPVARPSYDDKTLDIMLFNL